MGCLVDCAEYSGTFAFSPVGSCHSAPIDTKTSENFMEEIVNTQRIDFSTTGNLIL